MRMDCRHIDATCAIVIIIALDLQKQSDNDDEKFDDDDDDDNDDEKFDDDDDDDDDEEDVDDADGPVPTVPTSAARCTRTRRTRFRAGLAQKRPLCRFGMKLWYSHDVSNNLKNIPSSTNGLLSFATMLWSSSTSLRN